MTDGILLRNGRGLMTKKMLLDLPSARYNDESTWWNSVLIVPTPRQHDSGFAHIAVIGCTRDRAMRIIAMPDDIALPHDDNPFTFGDNRVLPDIRMDCYWPSMALRIWSNSIEFSIDYPTSSVTINTRKKEKK